ncbi:MAG: hypothetical protein RLZZ214_776, partial [Verrucomicrobiota bacterium]
IQQVLDGSISQPAFDQFQQRLRLEPELAKNYGDYALLHHSLCEEYEGQVPAGNGVPVSGRAFSAKFAFIAAAAAVALLVAVFYRESPSEAQVSPMVAAVRFSPDAVWQIDGSTGKSGESVELSKGATLQLLHGQASVAPSASASALIEGPSTLTFVSDESLHLAEGRGRFRSDSPGGHLEVTTPSMSAVDLGTEFGIETHRDAPDELHVLDGKVGMRLNGKNERHILAAGRAGRVAGTDGIEEFSADESRFAKSLSQFHTLMTAPFVKADWRVDYGNPSISAERIDGVNYSVFRRFSRPEPGGENSVLLATLEAKTPSSGNFHTDGWAGMSFFSKGTEVLFFGDAFGPERTWALDVKQRIPIILPGNLVVGARTVTLRYDRKSGEVSLHEGRVPLGPAFCTGKLPPETAFDEIRIGASSSAALAVGSLTVSVGGGRQ